MFKLKLTGSNRIHHLYDISTLEDVAIGLLDDEVEAKRIATIAGNMKIGDGYVANKWTMICVEEG